MPLRKGKTDDLRQEKNPSCIMCEVHRSIGRTGETLSETKYNFHHWLGSRQSSEDNREKLTLTNLLSVTRESSSIGAFFCHSHLTLLLSHFAKLNCNTFSRQRFSSFVALKGGRKLDDGVQKGKAFALHRAHLGSIPGAVYRPLNTSRRDPWV